MPDSSCLGVRLFFAVHTVLNDMEATLRLGPESDPTAPRWLRYFYISRLRKTHGVWDLTSLVAAKWDWDWEPNSVRDISSLWCKLSLVWKKLEWASWYVLLLLKKNLFIFGCAGSLLLCTGFLKCADFSLWWLLLLWSTGSRAQGFSSCVSWASEHTLRDSIQLQSSL